jgi:hypothetical protein
MVGASTSGRLGGLADVERDLIRTPHRRRPQPGAEAGAAHGPTAEIDGGAEGRSTAAAGAGRYACRTRAQLPCGQKHDFKGDGLMATWGTGTEKFPCPKCGAEYQCQYTDYPSRESGRFKCVKCASEVISWNGSRDYSNFKLIENHT